jgi:hypothetical protein
VLHWVVLPDGKVKAWFADCFNKATMAATAQDSLAPLRSGEGKKDEDREEESTLGNSAKAVPADC